MKQKEIINTICARIDTQFDESVHCLQNLVRIPSVTGDEGHAQEFVSNLYEVAGLNVSQLVADKTKVEKHPAFCDSGKPFQERPNIIGIQAGDPQKCSIVLNAHVDVVPVEDDWTVDPWGAEVREQKMYGRGTADCKAGIIANLFALKALKQADIGQLGTIMLQSVIEEEDGGGGGTLACFINGYTADGMIVAEPAPWVTVALAGILRCIIRVRGQSAHPSQSHFGVNAIGKILPIYQALEQLDLKRKTEIRYPLFELAGGPACHLIVGYLRGGKWIASVAGEAEMGVRIGFVPGEKTDDIKNMIETLVKQTADRDEWLREHPPLIEWQPAFFDPYHQDPSHPFVRSVVSSVRRVAGQEGPVEISGAGWSEDTRLAQFFNMPALSFGPKAEHVHGPDECVHLDSLKSTTKAIAVAVYDWCSRDKLT